MHEKLQFSFAIWRRHSHGIATSCETRPKCLLNEQTMVTHQFRHHIVLPCDRRVGTGSGSFRPWFEAEDEVEVYKWAKIILR